MRFVIFGDSKGKENGINEAVLNKIMNQTLKLNPEPRFIVVCGDSVAGSAKEEVLNWQLLRFRKLIEKYHPNKLLIPVIGNHEVNIDPVNDRYEKVVSGVYGSLVPDGALEGYNKTVYFMDFDDTRIIVLNAFHFGSIHKIDKRQLMWFEKIASINKRNKILFVHSPAFPTGAHLGHCLDLYPEDRDAFWEVVEKCGIDIVFAGHEHNYSRRIIKGVYQVITGGGGEKLRDKYNSKVGVIVPPINVYHFVVVDIEVSSVKVSAISSYGKKLDEFNIEKG
jgi:predicted phosphodiesterase